MNGFQCRGAAHAKRGSTSAVLLLVVAAVLAGAAIAVVVAVRAAGPGAACGEKVATNPLRPTAPQTTSAPSESGQAGSPIAAPPPAAPPPTTPPPATPPPATPGEHPLDPAIAMAEKVLAHIRKDVKDYTAVIDKQERIDSVLGEPVFMAAKVRQQPFSVYLKFLSPNDARGREVIYVAGANDGNLLVRDASGWTRALGMLSLPSTGPIAMHGSRYPIADLGLEHLTARLLEIAEQDRRYGEVEVHFFSNAKVNGRVCTLIEVVHPVERRVFLFHRAQIYIDDQLNVPIRYAAYMWPKQPGGEPPLDEAYTYLKLKLNVGLTDEDFDPHNPKYGFFDK